MKSDLKPYMGYSREWGAPEGAVLIFANDIKEAKRLCWYKISGTITDDYTDMAVNLMKDSDFMLEQVPEWSKKKLAENIPHVVESPPCCKGCEMWGYELDENGYCEGCADDIKSQ